MRRGKGFGYVDAAGARVRDPEVLERVRDLVVPPAWEDVWICADPFGHLQATGVDAAGRKQYLYHPLWRERRDRKKFDEMLDFAAQLPSMRRTLDRQLEGDELTRERVLACAVLMLDIGLFRIGGEQYVDEDREGGLGLATIRREHVSLRDGALFFDYPAKSGVQRVHSIADPRAIAIVTPLVRRRGGHPELLAFRAGRRWARIGSDDINAHLKELVGEQYSAKDFRTWNATVLAAIDVAALGQHAATKTARKRVMSTTTKNVAAMLGNTPAVARRSYIDPRVFDRFQSGWTIHSELEGVADLESLDIDARRRIEAAVADLLTDPRDSALVERVVA